MRILLDAKMPHEPFNTLVREGTAGAKISRVLEELQPEAAYFSEEDGHRRALLVVNVDDVSEIPSKAEPLFLSFDAEVRMRVCMTPEDLGRSGLDELGEEWP